MTSADDALRVREQADCLHDAQSVQRAFDTLAGRIAPLYDGLDPVLMTVMNGGLYATSEIARRLDFAFRQDYLQASRYRGATTGGGLTWKRQPEAEALAGQHVLVVDDILDEGYTLVAIRRALEAFKPASLRVAVLVRKRHDRCTPGAHAEFVGLEVEDRYVFGCGMDYKEYWRQLPAIYAVKGM